MFSLCATIVTTIICFTYVHTIKGDHQQHKIVPCFGKHFHVDIHQLDNRIPINYINCTRQLVKHVFTITFELQRRQTNNKSFGSNLVVTLFAGSCSSSMATLNTGRTFPSIHGSLDGSFPSAVTSSHLPSDGQSQQGTISFEYGGSGAENAQLISVLIHVVIRHGREDLIRGVYAIKFYS